MKKVEYLITIIIVLFTLSTCKKYPDGGFVNQTRLHLFGGHKVGDSKTWKLKLYEVNGIDSTYLIQGAGTIPDFYDKFVTFKYVSKGDPSIEYSASTFLCDYAGIFDYTYKQLTLGIPVPLTRDDSMQCKIVDGTRYCSRNLLFPEFNNYGKLWNIQKLTKHECVLKTNHNLINSYKIILTH